MANGTIGIGNVGGLIGFRDHYNCLYKYKINCSINIFQDNVLNWDQRLVIAQGTADGVNYLHTFKEKPLVHRDVKSANILLDENMIPKVKPIKLKRFYTM